MKTHKPLQARSLGHKLTSDPGLTPACPHSSWLMEELWEQAVPETVRQHNPHWEGDIRGGWEETGANEGQWKKNNNLDQWRRNRWKIQNPAISLWKVNECNIFVISTEAFLTLYWKMQPDTKHGLFCSLCQTLELTLITLMHYMFTLST